MLFLLCLALFLPLIGFLVITASSGVISRKMAGIIACSTLFISFVCFVSILQIYENMGADPRVFVLYKWIPVAGINADFSLRIDSLSLLMTLIITGVGFLIHVYSIGYMDHEEDYARYFACLNFFVFSMLLLVLAEHLLLLFVGWEGVGLASYLLIGFWYTKPAAAQAATKAFVVNRIGDLGLLLGLLMTFNVFGTGDIAEVSRRATEGFAVGATALSVISLLYFIGATGKSAQLPLHTWLPDAMEGPTPVSALIHAATMVTAGVYLVVRMHPVFLQAPEILQFVGYVGGVTALFAALCAVGQTDLKRVLAYSTVSQLGLMFLACGEGAFFAAMFHLTTHAFVKALLFLSAGNVVHMMHGTTEMDRMGGLSKIFTKTHWLFLVGVLAMSGIPPFAAFFSKDLILEQGHLAGFETLFVIGLFVSLLTAFYLTRAYCLTFTGPQRFQEPSGDIHEAPRVMLLPVSILTLLAIIGGFLGFCLSCRTPILENFLAEADVALGDEVKMNISFIFSFVTVISTIVALIGIAAAAWIYTNFGERFRAPIQTFKKSFYIDEIYDKVIVQPLEAVARFIADIFEPKVFDRSIRITAQGTQGVAQFLQQTQSGQIRSYIAWIVIGSVLVLAYLALL